MLILEFEEHRTNEEGKEIFESCDWWKELVSRAAQDADRFEVRCWEDEQEGIAFGQQYGQKQESSTKEIVFAGELTGQALSALVGDCVGADGVLKYFTLNLYAREKLLFSSSHYGSEIYSLKGLKQMCIRDRCGSRRGFKIFYLESVRRRKAAL